MRNTTTNQIMCRYILYPVPETNSGDYLEADGVVSATINVPNEILQQFSDITRKLVGEHGSGVAGKLADLHYG